MTEGNPNKPTKNRVTRSLRKLLRLALLLAVLLAATLIAYIFFNSQRPLPTPRVLTQPNPALIALLKSGIATTKPVTPSITSHTLPHNPLTTFTTDTTNLAANAHTYELIPENELARPDQKAAVRRFNAEFRRWAALLSLYCSDPERYRQLPKKETEPYGENVYVGYHDLRDQLNKAGLGSPYDRKLSEAYLQLITHYGFWSEAAWTCYNHQNWYTWNDFLYCMRRERRPLVKYPNIAIYSVLHLTEIAIAKPNGKP